MNVKVSVLILAKNEESNITDCIKSVSFADEVIVIDDYSDDQTKALAEKLGAKVIQHNLAGDWGGQQTFAISQAANDWILFLDADERISPELAKEIGETIDKNDLAAYWIKRITKLKHNKVAHGVLRPDYVCRLMPTKGSRVEGYVHPAIIHPYTNKKLANVMYHYTYDNWDQYFNKINVYAKLAAEKYKKAGKRVNFFFDIILRPLWAFFKIYFLQLGFLDGKLGWILSINHSFYTMNKYVRLYYLYRTNGKL